MPEMTPKQQIEKVREIAVRTQDCVTNWSPEARLLGNVKAAELAEMTAGIISILDTLTQSLDGAGDADRERALTQWREVVACKGRVNALAPWVIQHIEAALTTPTAQVKTDDVRDEVIKLLKMALDDEPMFAVKSWIKDALALLTTGRE